MIILVSQIVDKQTIYFFSKSLTNRLIKEQTYQTQHLFAVSNQSVNFHHHDCHISLKLNSSKRYTNKIFPVIMHAPRCITSAIATENCLIMRI